MLWRPVNLAATLALVVLIAAVLGFLAESLTHRSAAPPANDAAIAQDMVLNFPHTWERVTTGPSVPGLALSNANRMAALGLLKTLADEVAGDGVTVNTVATGMFATDRLADRHGSLDQAQAAAHELIPARRLGRPEEYGDLVAFLCSERAAYLTGAVIPLDGGNLRSV